MSTQPTELDTYRLHVAIHELGHYVAWNSLPGARIISVRVWGHGTRTAGYTDAWLPDDDHGALDRGYLIGLLAGHEAALIHREITGIRFAPGCSGDYAAFRSVRRRHKPSRQWTRHELRTAARHLVRAHWPQIEKLAPRLARRGHL
jgi:hypothetical protein